MCGFQGATLFGTLSFSPVASNMAPRPSPNVSKRGPRLPQEGPTGHQNGSKIGPRELQEASKKDDSSPANRLWTGQDGPKTPQDDNLCVCEYVYVYAYVYVYVYVFVYLCLTIYCSNSLLPTIRLSIGYGWAGGDTRRVNNTGCFLACAASARELAAFDVAFHD